MKKRSVFISTEGMRRLEERESFVKQINLKEEKNYD